MDRLLVPLWRAACCASLFTSWNVAAELPSGGNVVNGTATIHTSQGAPELFVEQSSDRAIIEWDSFSIGAQHVVHFVQEPDQAILNRVTGDGRSIIDGMISAPGAVWLLNPNGVLIGEGARVDTGSFLATTLSLDDTNFLDGNQPLALSGPSAEGIVNRGEIAALGGDIVLVANHVENHGALVAPAGRAVLAAGNDVRLTFNAGGLDPVSVEINVSDVDLGNDFGIDQQGAIDAALVQLAAAGGNLYGLAVNAGGTITAHGDGNGAPGRIYLVSDGGNIQVTPGASLTASAGAIALETSGTVSIESNSELDVSGEAGGTVRIIGGESVAVADGAVIRAGDASGGDVTLAAADLAFRGEVVNPGGNVRMESGALIYDGRVDLTAADGAGDLRLDFGDAAALVAETGASRVDATALSATLDTANVFISSWGGVTVVDPVAWSSVNELRVVAPSPIADVTINETISAPSGRLAFERTRNIAAEAAVAVSELEFVDGNGDVTFTNSDNRFERVVFRNGGQAEVGRVALHAGAGDVSLAAEGSFPTRIREDFLVTTGGDLTLEQSFALDVGGMVTLAALNGAVHNAATAGGTVFASPARVRVYAASESQLGGLEVTRTLRGVSYPEDPAADAGNVLYYAFGPELEPEPDIPDEEQDAVTEQHRQEQAHMQQSDATPPIPEVDPPAGAEAPGMATAGMTTAEFDQLISLAQDILGLDEAAAEGAIERLLRTIEESDDPVARVREILMQNAASTAERRRAQQLRQAQQRHQQQEREAERERQRGLMNQLQDRNQVRQQEQSQATSSVGGTTGGESSSAEGLRTTTNSGTRSQVDLATGDGNEEFKSFDVRGADADELRARLREERGPAQVDLGAPSPVETASPLSGPVRIDWGAPR